MYACMQHPGNSIELVRSVRGSIPRFFSSSLYYHEYMNTIIVESITRGAPRVIVVGQSVCVCVCVCVYSESAHLDAIVLCLYYG